MPPWPERASLQHSRLTPPSPSPPLTLIFIFIFTLTLGRERVHATSTLTLRLLQVHATSFNRFGSVPWSLRVPRSEVVLGATLGEGSFGVVFAASWRGRAVAVSLMTSPTPTPSPSPSPSPSPKP